MLHAIKEQHTYRIIGKLAEGGMGAVYEAIQIGTRGFHKTVALKMLRPEIENNPDYVHMFIEEAKLVANLVHENIVQMYQLGHCEQGYYCVMEFVRGLPLRDFIRFHNDSNKRIPVHLVVFIASRIARGLSYAHTFSDPYGRPMDIVHRDVCPSNILITTEGLPKLADFGVAKTVMMDDAAGNRTFGKLSYMAPEQALGQSIAFTADIYSLGAVMFEMLCGQRSRGQGSADDVMVKAIKGVVEWGSLPPDLAPELRAILTQCLALNPDDRYAHTRELAEALEYFIYKDGYGPTIQTIEDYLRQQLPELYTYESGRQQLAEAIEKTILTDAGEELNANAILE